MVRKSFIFYRSFYEATLGLKSKQKSEIFDAIMEYSFNFHEKNLKGIEKNIFALIKPQLEANNKKFKKGCEGAKFGHLGGMPNNPIDNPMPPPIDTPIKTPNVNDNVNVNDNEKVNGLFFDFLEMRKSIKKSPTNRAIGMLKNKLLKYPDEVKIIMLEKSILNNWQDLYEPKADATPQKPFVKSTIEDNKW